MVSIIFFHFPISSSSHVVPISPGSIRTVAAGSKNHVDLQQAVVVCCGTSGKAPYLVCGPAETTTPKRQSGRDLIDYRGDSSVDESERALSSVNVTVLDSMK